jgi:hypothetical protein
MLNKHLSLKNISLLGQTHEFKKQLQITSFT